MTGDKPNPLTESEDFFIQTHDEDGNDIFRVVETFNLQHNEREAAIAWWEKHLKGRCGKIDQTGHLIWSEGLGYSFTRTSVGVLVSCVCDFCGESELVSEP